MKGRYETLGQDTADLGCPTPGTFERWWLRVKPNAVFVCECGQKWSWTAATSVFSTRPRQAHECGPFYSWRPVRPVTEFLDDRG